MTTPITKELREHAEENVKALRLAVKQHAFKDIRDAIEMDLKVAEFALAAMDAEPVGEFYHEKQGGWYEISKGDKVPDNRRIPLYAAPPAPVVPEDIPDSVYEILCQACGGKAWMYEDALWKACRAAMLNHSENERGMVELVRTAYKLPPNSFTNDDLEMMAHGDNPQANAYRELLAFRSGISQ